LSNFKVKPPKNVFVFKVEIFIFKKLKNVEKSQNGNNVQIPSRFKRQIEEIICKQFLSKI